MLAIFDLDGTLVDSQNNIASTINFVRNSVNLPPLDVKLVGENLNRIDINPSEFFYNTKTFEDWQFELFTKHYYEICDQNISLYDGILDAIHKFKDQNIKLAVATNGSSKFANKILTTLGIANNFEAIFGADMVSKPKPDPAMLISILDIIQPQKTVFVGDSAKDLLAARAINAKFAFAGWGFGPNNVESDLHLDSSKEIDKISLLF